MKRAVPLLLVLLAGCVQSLPVGAERPPREADIVVIDAVRDAWIAAGNPYTSQCVADHGRLVVIRTDHVSIYCASRGPCCGTMEKQDACRCSLRTGGAGCAAGATTLEADIVQPFAGMTDTWRVMLWVSQYEDEQTQRRVVAHEAVHWLGTCGAEDNDAPHTRHPEWWGAQGLEAAGW